MSHTQTGLLYGFHLNFTKSLHPHFLHTRVLPKGKTLHECSTYNQTSYTECFYHRYVKRVNY